MRFMGKWWVYYGFLIGILLNACGGKSSSEDSTPSDITQGLKEKEGDLFLDSLRMHSPFTRADFNVLYKADSLRWHLVTDLLTYSYFLNWNQPLVWGNLALDSRVVDQLLVAAPAYFSFPQGLSTDQEYKALQIQCERLTDFQTDNGKEENYKKGLQRFMERYLSARCARKLAELPKNASLYRALENERALWFNHLKAETVFYETLSANSYPNRFSELGMKKGEFWDSRWKRREEADRVTYFALTAPSFQSPFTEYVTWAETQQEYAVLQGRLYPTATASLKNALTNEAAAWFAFAKGRTAVEDLLNGPAKQAYAAETRLLKKYHLNDLKTW